MRSPSSFGDSIRPAAPRSRSRRGVRAAAEPTTVEELNRKFALPPYVTFVEGKGGLPMARLEHASGASAIISLFGGQILSFCQGSGDEVLYVRPDAVFDRSKAIAGGIPICFPIFGPPKEGDEDTRALPQHGFARLRDWQVVSTSADPIPDDRDPQIELVLKSDEETLRAWPHRFAFHYSVHIHGESLRLDCRVVNEGDNPLTFSAALHTYVEVLGLGAARVRGLRGKTYLDKTLASKPDASDAPARENDAELVAFPVGPVSDRVFVDADEYFEVQVGTGAALGVSSEGWSDVVLWNPGERAAPSCFNDFACAENARYSEPVTLQPGQDWRGQVAMNVLDL